MAELVTIMIFTGIFLAVKAVEYRGVPTWGSFTSIGAWVAFGVAVVVMLLT